MTVSSDDAAGRPLSSEDVRDMIATQVRIPNHLTPHGARAFVNAAVDKVETVTSELDLKATELRAKRLPPELTEESVVEALERLVEKQRQATLRAAADVADSDQKHVLLRSRRRRRWAAALATIGSAGIAVSPLAGPFALPLAGGMFLLVLGNVYLTLNSAE